MAAAIIRPPAAMMIMNSTEIQYVGVKTPLKSRSFIGRPRLLPPLGLQGG